MGAAAEFAESIDKKEAGEPLIYQSAIDICVDKHPAANEETITACSALPCHRHQYKGPLRDRFSGRIAG